MKFRANRRGHGSRVAGALLASLALLATSTATAGAQADAPDVAPPSVSDRGTVEVVLNTNRRFTDASLTRLTGVDIDTVERVDALNTTVIEVAADDADAVVDSLAARGDVSNAYVASKVTSFATNDPLWPRQTWMASQKFERMWAATTGSNDMIVAVIDTGVNETPDLAGRVFDGYDFLTGRAARNNDDDPDSHGTIAASIIAASGNDGVGVAGACWRCRILPLKVLDADGNGSSVDVAYAIKMAADRGASIINLSLGGPGADPMVAAAVDYAEARGAIVVASAGNDYEDYGAQARYPAAFPQVIGVASWVNDSYGLAPFSQRGRDWYEVAAGACFLDADVDDVCGTSFSAPYVSGLLALLRSLRPDLDAATHKSILFSSALPYPASLAQTIRYGRIDAGVALDRSYSIPIVDREAPKASLTVKPGPYNAKTAVAIEVHTSDNQAVGNTSVMIGGLTLASWTNTRIDTTFMQPTSVIAQMFGDGTHTIRLVATDTSGNVTEAQANITIDTKGPVAAVFRPGTNTTVRRNLDIVAYSQDPSGTVATFIIVNQKVVSGWLGDGAHSARVPITKNGRYHIVTLTIDRADNISASNHVFVDGRRR